MQLMRKDLSQPAGRLRIAAQRIAGFEHRRSPGQVPASRQSGHEAQRQARRDRWRIPGRKQRHRAAGQQSVAQGGREMRGLGRQSGVHGECVPAASQLVQALGPVHVDL